MSENLENSAVNTDLEKFSFHSSPEEGQWQRMFKALISLTSKVMFKILQANGSSSTWTRNFQMYKLGLKKTEEQRSNCKHSLEKAREFQKYIYFSFIDYAKSFDCVDHNKMWRILTEMRVPNHLTCLLRNLYAGKETTVRTRLDNWLIPNWEKSTTRLCTVALLI